LACVLLPTAMVWNLSGLGTDHLTSRGGYGFLFRSEICFRTTQELEYIFFCRAKRENFFQNLALVYMTKTLIQIFFFLHQNQNIFFSNIGNQNIFLEINHNPPFKLNGRSLSLDTIEFEPVYQYWAFFFKYNNSFLIIIIYIRQGVIVSIIIQCTIFNKIKDIVNKKFK
jgi:hypothetical protein